MKNVGFPAVSIGFQIQLHHFREGKNDLQFVYWRSLANYIFWKFFGGHGENHDPADNEIFPNNRSI